MTRYKQLKLTHANLNQELSIVIGTLAGYHYAETSKCTHVYTIAGIFPALESPEQIAGLIDQLTKGEENERPTE